MARLMASMAKIHNQRIKRLIFAAILLICSLLVVLLHDIFETTCNTPYTRMTTTKEQQDNLMELQLSTLVKEEEKSTLENTGLSCSSWFRTEVCVTTKQVRIDTKSLNVFVSTTQDVTPKVNDTKIIKPYARKTDSRAMNMVQPLQIIQVTSSITLPACEHTHNVPVVVFSTGGYAGNAFHSINDILIPLFLTSRHFRSLVRFLITDNNPMWVSKYNRVLKRLSSYEVIKADNVSGSVHCFPGGVIGLNYHEFLGINSTEIPKGYKFDDFREFLFGTYNLKVMELVAKPEKPIVLFISRAEGRMWLNEAEVVNMIAQLGFEVRIVHSRDMSDIDKLSSLVNSCHVMVGVHGAGFTNEVFLPKGAVLVQVIPIGLNWQSTVCYANPGSKMGLKSLEYHVEYEESSLSESYSPNDPVIVDPHSVDVKGGFAATKAIYLDTQNVKINVTKFKDTMSHAFELLQE